MSEPEPSTRLPLSSQGMFRGMTKTSTDPAPLLLSELSVLLRLTRTEAQIARVRISQAQRAEIRGELAENAREADARAGRLQTAIRSLGGVPDVVSDAVGRVAAMTKTAFEQGQPLSEALLSDLALEHQLHDRAMFARVLAESLGRTRLVALLRQLEEAHIETIEWINVRLAEVAQGGPAALAPTPAQAAVGAVARAAMLPSRQGAALVNRAVDLVQRGRDSAVEATEAAREGVEKTARATSDVVAVSRDAALARAEEVAPYAGIRRAVHGTRETLGTIEPRDLPIKNYQALSVEQAVKAIKRLRNADDIRVVLSYEQAHKARKGVVTAGQKQISDLAAESVNA